MSELDKTDYLIVGAGILGIAIGLEILRADSRAKVVVLEKENEPGLHASGRNSGVLHSGLYYSKNSLKANFTSLGNQRLKSYMHKKGLPLLNLGKIITASDDQDVKRLEGIMRSAKYSGARVFLLGENELKDYEPLAITHKKFIWSPDTSIGSPKHVMDSLVQDFLDLGGKILLNSRLSEIQGNYALINQDSKIAFRVLINCAGTGALNLAKMAGLGRNYKLLPVLGSYLSVDLNQLPLSKLVYSTPHPSSPFLGVHFTQSFTGNLKIGPTAIPLLNREQYTIKTRLKMKELIESMDSLSLFVRKDPIFAFQMVSMQLKGGTSRGMIRSASKLVPSVGEIRSWKREPAGIRAQLVDNKSGKLVNDFVIERNEFSIHILNAVSPGWTSALPFAEYIVRTILKLDYPETV